MALCFSGGSRKWINLFGWLSGNWTQLASSPVESGCVRGLLGHFGTPIERTHHSLCEPLGTLFMLLCDRRRHARQNMNTIRSTINRNPVIEGFLTERLANTQYSLHIWGQLRSGLYIANGKNQNTRSLNPKRLTLSSNDYRMMAGPPSVGMSPGKTNFSCSPAKVDRLNIYKKSCNIFGSRAPFRTSRDR